jgi:hypothetical protein
VGGDAAGDAHDNQCEARTGANACGGLRKAACTQRPECLCEYSTRGPAPGSGLPLATAGLILPRLSGRRSLDHCTSDHMYLGSISDYVCLGLE